MAFLQQLSSVSSRQTLKPIKQILLHHPVNERSLFLVNFVCQSYHWFNPKNYANVKT